MQLTKISTRKSQGSQLQHGDIILTRQKLLGKLTITLTYRASKDIEFRVNITSLRLTAPSEFLFNKLILKLCPLVNGSVNLMESCLTATLYFRGPFLCVFQNRSISFSYVLDSLQNNSVNHIFSIVIKTPSNCPSNVQQLALLKSIFCQIIQNTVND